MEMSKPVMTAWSDSHEFNTVFNSIYQNKDSIDYDFDYDLLTFAKNKLTIWLTRIQNNIEINVNLMATKEIINALIEDNRNCRTVEELTDESAVYSLFALSVIRFCSAISEYSHESNMKSVKRLAHRYSCPQWVIDCRHNLCHSSVNQPSIQELRTASLIGLNWLRQYFWLKIKTNLNSKSDKNENYFELIDRFVNNDNNNKKKKKIKNEVILALINFRNDFIGALVQYLINSNNNGLNINEKSHKVPKLYLRKFSQIFSILINYNSLSIVFNLIVKYFDCENPSKRHLAISWFSTLIKAIESENKLSKFKRIFKNVSFNAVMPKIDWIRLLYSVVKRPNPMTPTLIQLIAPIVCDVISEEKINILMNLSKIYSSNTLNDNKDSEEVNDEEFSVKTVKDLISPTEQMNSTALDLNDPIDWSQISFGASIQFPSNLNYEQMPTNIN